MSNLASEEKTVKCIHCKTPYETKLCGREAWQGFLCNECWSKFFDVFRVKIGGCGDYIAKDIPDAMCFIQTELEESEELEQITLFKEKMSVLEYYNLKEWDG